MDVDFAQKYVSSGLEVTNIKLIRRIQDVNNDENVFLPDMCHQVFGENETIFGYQNLKINILYDAATFKCYVNHTFDDKVKPDLELNLTPENVMEKLDPWLPPNYYTNKNEFMDNLAEKDKLKPFGNILHSFTLDTGAKKNRKFEIYTCKGKDADYIDFHQRMETLIVWFIDAANFIDIEDTKWQFFILYEKIEDASFTRYYPVGYSTVYEYFAYPDSRRYRISQFIVFPPYQNIGLGTELLKTIYNYLTTLCSIYDITVEDPSDKFQSIRDYLDVKNCLTLLPFNMPLIKADFNKDMINEARMKFKINEKQIRRIYEILRLLNTNVDDPKEYNSYKMMVKNRLNAPFKRQQQHNKKCSKFFKEIPHIQTDHNIKVIEKQFQLLMKQYRHIIYRIQKKN